MTDLGTLAYFLGLEFVTTSKGILLHQQKYATDVLKRFHMADCNPANTPAEVNTKLEIAEEEEAVDPTMFMNNPKKSHLTIAKRILRYVKGTLEYGILFPRKTDQRTVSLLGYSDSDWCEDKIDRRSTTGYLFKFLGAPISWCSKKQPVVALSSCEAEYIAGSYAACQAIWLDLLLDN
ncbi:secreted RxLR effector protein 161-like [Glycine max]|uniref:secreted RxLR effector protein 161-like n=1 Tax=Glycine max TaxID=3847 RepID=UPI001B356148|nr:secreted RxLR effector protein 161-like [Glycine max]